MDLKDDYARKAELLRVIDGDTIECIIDLGLKIYKKTKIRVFGINCPETKGDSKPAGLVSKNFTKEWFATNKEFMVRTVNQGKEDSFGRLIAEVASMTGESLGDMLLSLGYAVKYEDK